MPRWEAGRFIADITLIISGFAWAIFMIYNKKMSDLLHFGDFPVNDLGACIYVSFNRAVWVFCWTTFFALSGFAWFGIFWTAIVCWVIPYYLWLEGLKHLSASTSTVLLLSEIVMAVILSIVILKEPVTVFSSIGAILIVVAIALVSVQDKKGQKPLQALPPLMLKLKYVKLSNLGRGEIKWQKN